MKECRRAPGTSTSTNDAEGLGGIRGRSLGKAPCGRWGECQGEGTGEEGRRGEVEAGGGGGGGRQAAKVVV